VEANPKPFVLSVDGAVGVTAVTVDVTYADGQAAVRHQVVTWCRDSGESDQKSHIAVLERMLVFG
jgi:hypothetical protein